MNSPQSGVLIFIVCVMLTVPVFIRPADEEIFWEPLTFWKEKNLLTGELGRILVPENRKKPDSHMIEVAFFRLKSTADKPAPPYHDFSRRTGWIRN